jgi:ring-1,2-phenylacetyl-CoA epoxidase subunit PaaC
MQAAVDAVTPLIDELFRPHPTELRLARDAVAVDPSAARPEFDAVWAQVLEAAKLRPATGVSPVSDGDTGRDGVHTDALTDILTELQSVARSLPGGVW